MEKKSVINIAKRKYRSLGACFFDRRKRKGNKIVSWTNNNGSHEKLPPPSHRNIDFITEENDSCSPIPEKYRGNKNNKIP